MKPLSILMRESLSAIQKAGGDEAISDLPGGERTVEALERRGLVYRERSQFGVAVAALTVEGLSFHVHRFTLTMHLDGCHWFQNVGKCDCGASISQYSERDLNDDPYSGLWLDEAEECERCKELRAGAEPISRSEVIKA